MCQGIILFTIEKYCSLTAPLFPTRLRPCFHSVGEGTDKPTKKWKKKKKERQTDTRAHTDGTIIFRSQRPQKPLWGAHCTKAMAQQPPKPDSSLFPLLLREQQGSLDDETFKTLPVAVNNIISIIMKFTAEFSVRILVPVATFVNVRIF